MNTSNTYNTYNAPDISAILSHIHYIDNYIVNTLVENSTCSLGEIQLEKEYDAMMEYVPPFVDGEMLKSFIKTRIQEKINAVKSCMVLDERIANYGTFSTSYAKRIMAMREYTGGNMKKHANMVDTIVEHCVNNFQPLKSLVEGEYEYKLCRWIIDLLYRHDVYFTNAKEIYAKINALINE